MVLYELVDRGAAVRAAAACCRRRSSRVRPGRRRRADAEHAGSRRSRRTARPPAAQHRHTTPVRPPARAPRRPRLDRAQGDRARPRPALRDRQRARARHPAPPGEQAGRRAAADARATPPPSSSAGTGSASRRRRRRWLALVVALDQHRARADPRRARGREGAGDQRLPRGHAEVGRPLAGRRAADDGGEALRAGVTRVDAGRHPRPARRRLRSGARSDRVSGPRPARRGRHARARGAAPSGSRGPGRRARRPPRACGPRRLLYFDAGKVRLGRAGARTRARDPAAAAGCGRHLVAGSLLDLADWPTRQGERAAADSLAREALAILRRCHGDRHLARGGRDGQRS